MKLFLYPLLALILCLPLDAQIAKPVLDDKSYDFGLITIGTEVRHTFSIKNTSKSPVKVGAITISCDCTKIVQHPEVIAPGATGQFLAVMNHTHTGYTNITIHVPTGPRFQDLIDFHLVGVLIAANPTNAPAQDDDFVTAQEALKHKEALWIDIREPRLYSQSHAAGAQCASLLQLEARDDLKKHYLVLLNDGNVDSTTLSRIDALKKKGFENLRILKDGYPAWRLASGPVVGVELSSLSLMSAKDFYSQHESGWLVVNTDGVALATSYPQENVTSKNPQEVLRQIQMEVAKNKESHVLVTNQYGNGYEAIQNTLKGMTIPVYYLSGGDAVYTQTIQQQTLALAPQPVKLTPDQAYLSSARAEGQIVRGGGCSSCGH